MNKNFIYKMSIVSLRVNLITNSASEVKFMYYNFWINKWVLSKWEIQQEYF